MFNFYLFKRIVPLVALFVGLFTTFFVIIPYFLSNENEIDKNETQIVIEDNNIETCNRFSDGCTLDFNTDRNLNPSFMKLYPRVKSGLKIDSIGIKFIFNAGNRKELYMLPYFVNAHFDELKFHETYLKFPRYFHKKNHYNFIKFKGNLIQRSDEPFLMNGVPLNINARFDSIVSPYSFNFQGGKLLIKGELFDYKTDKPLGWFDENEFEIIKNENGGCAYRFNKDKNGIEIVNTKFQVCFSLNIVEKQIYFKGYFKDDNGNIYIYNDKQYVTKDINEAERLISKINPIFDHKDLSGKLGKRIVY